MYINTQIYLYIHTHVLFLYIFIFILYRVLNSKDDKISEKAVFMRNLPPDMHIYQKITRPEKKWSKLHLKKPEKKGQIRESRRKAIISKIGKKPSNHPLLGMRERILLEK